jgi:hypothetical protein
MAILNLCQVLVLQNVFGKMEFVPDGVLGGYCRGTGMVRSTRRVLPWHGCGSEYLQGTAEEMEMVMCD